MGYNFQQLSLILKPIKIVSNTHFPFTIVKLFDSEGFSESVDQILLFIDLYKIDVASFHDLSYDMVVPQNVLGVVIRPRLLSLSNGSNIIIKH